MNQKLARLLLVAAVLIPGYAGAVTEEDFKAKLAIHDPPSGATKGAGSTFNGHTN